MAIPPIPSEATKAVMLIPRFERMKRRPADQRMILVMRERPWRAVWFWDSSF